MEPARGLSTFLHFYEAILHSKDYCAHLMLFLTSRIAIAPTITVFNQFALSRRQYTKLRSIYCSPTTPNFDRI